MWQLHQPGSLKSIPKTHLYIKTLQEPQSAGGYLELFTCTVYTCFWDTWGTRLQWVWEHGVSLGPYDVLGTVDIVETAVLMQSLILCCIEMNSWRREGKHIKAIKLFAPTILFLGLDSFSVLMSVWKIGGFEFLLVWGFTEKSLHGRRPPKHNRHKQEELLAVGVRSEPGDGSKSARF